VEQNWLHILSGFVKISKMNLQNNQEKVEDFESEPEKLVDDVAEKVVELLGKNPPVRRIRKSQILSALVGAIGFALFMDGITKLFVNIAGWTSLIIGSVLMAITGLLLRNLYR